MPRIFDSCHPQKKWNGVDFVVVTDPVSSLPIALQRRPLHLHGSASARPCGEVATQDTHARASFKCLFLQFSDIFAKCRVDYLANNTWSRILY